ncbi:MAG: aminotransferase class IV [Gammaproteobacteria bacterium]|nr:aminotransferase class IV [Gammaproteobacteria bacterium]
MKVWHRGHIGDARECRVPLLDHGLLYGDGVFEGIRITGGRVFRLDAHLARLARSARAIGLELPLGQAALADAVCATARAHGAPEAYVRVLVTRGVGALTLDPTDCHEPEFYCIVADIRMFSAEIRARGLRLATASQRRPRADMLDPQVKSLNYLNNVLAKREARLRGYDDALLLNGEARIAEASAANVFAVVDDVLVTPPTSEGALPGITRATVLECWRAGGGQAVERPLTAYDLTGASEAFLCGSGAGLIGIASLDDRIIGGADRPALAALAPAYAAYAARHGTPF